MERWRGERGIEVGEIDGEPCESEKFEFVRFGFMWRIFLYLVLGNSPLVYNCLILGLIGECTGNVCAKICDSLYE